MQMFTYFQALFLLLELLAFSLDLENPQHVSTEITCFICTTEKEARNTKISSIKTQIRRKKARRKKYNRSTFTGL